MAASTRGRGIVQGIEDTAPVEDKPVVEAHPQTMVPEMFHGRDAGQSL